MALPKYSLLVDKQPRKWYAKGNIYVEVVGLSKAEYPNRDALRKAIKIYLDAMFQFVSECLDEQSIRDFLKLQSSDDLREDIEVKDIANLIKSYSYWAKCFKAKFKIIDRDNTRYYDARSVTSLIIEGRNQLSHNELRKLDPEFTQSQLFLIADILGKIKRPDAQREVEAIRKKLFNDVTEQLVAKQVEAKEAEYEKSIVEVKKSLAAEETAYKEALEQLNDKDVKLTEKTEELQRLSEQLLGMKLSKGKSEEQLNSKSKELEKLQAGHSAYEERLTTTEAEKNDYKERFETTRKELEVCVDSLTSMRNLFMTATIKNPEIQALFPPIEVDSTVRILDRRGVDKKNYLLELLEQKQPTLIYVQSEEMVDLLLERVVPEKADVIGKCNARTSETEEAEILEKLKNGELIAVVSNTALSTLTSSHCVEHFVFCHLVPGLDEFFRQCEPAFTSEKNAYLHLIYNRKKDIEGLNQWLTQKYPDREVLVKMYRELERLAGVNGDFIKTENIYSELDIEKPSIETGLAIFAELQLLERNGEIIRFLPNVNTDLNKSTIHCRGEKLKKETADFQAFQLERSIEQIWEEMLARLSVDSGQILREVNTDEMYASVSEVKNGQQPTETVENDNTVDGEDMEVKQPPKSTRKSSESKKSAADKFREAKSLDERKEIGRQVAELRINSTGSKPSWRSIRTKLGLKNDEFHKVIRLEDHFRESVVERIESFEDGWQYDGKLEVLLGFEPLGELLERIEACKPTPKVEAKKEAEPQVEESKDKVR